MNTTGRNDEINTVHEIIARGPTSHVGDEEAVVVQEETEPIFRSMQTQHHIPQLNSQPRPQPQPQPQLESEPVVEPLPDIAPWIPQHVNRYPSDYPDQQICLEDLVTVAFRISECNRIRSIEAEYDTETATAKCIALRNTHFRITLFHGETERHIIVKIRRMSGCSLIFHEEYRALMNAAKFGEITTRKVLQYVETPTSDGQYRNDFIPLQDNVLEQILLSMNSHIHSGRYDVRVMALEDMASTTNSEHSLLDDTALKASTIIMEKNLGIRESVSSIILEKEDNAFNDDYVRSLALTILSNVLSTLSKEKTLTPFIQDKWYVSSLIPSLIDEINTAAKHPRNASLAAKCLSALFTNSVEACSQAGKDVLVTLEAAKRIGKSSYANLEKEAQVAIDKIVRHNN